MTKWSEWLADWRQVTAELQEGFYEPVEMRIERMDFEVLRVSLYDPEIDGKRRMLQTPARRFDNRIALLSRQTRDTGLVRVITFKGRKRYVVEPGSQVDNWAAAAEGVSVEELLSATRDGSLWSGIAKRAKREKKLRGILKAQLEELQNRVRDADDEANLLRIELRAVEKELARRGAE